MENFKKIELWRNNSGDTFMILDEFPEINYALLRRNTNFQPYVACWGFHKADGYWDQGHYLQTLEEALELINHIRK